MLKEDFSAAEPMFRQVLAHRRETLPARHWRIGSSESLLGECLAKQGRIEEASELLVSGYRILRDQWGEEDYLVVAALERINRYIGAINLEVEKT